MVAYELGIDVSMVKIKPVKTITNPNGFATGGSVGSECSSVVRIRLNEQYQAVTVLFRLPRRPARS